MGIDIRDGLQLECINCALCIDACNEVMAKVGRPRGLIAYDTDLNVMRREQGAPARFRFIRPRTVLYAALLAAVGLVMLLALSERASLDLNVLRDRSPPYVRLSDGGVRNGYTVKVINRTNEARRYQLTVDGPAGLALKATGLGQGETMDAFMVESDRVRPIRVFLTLEKGALGPPSVPVVFRLRDIAANESQSTASVFLSGAEG
jgi:cytochrome c oxidase accessory protein FixG